MNARFVTLTSLALIIAVSINANPKLDPRPKLGNLPNDTIFLENNNRNASYDHIIIGFEATIIVDGQPKARPQIENDVLTILYTKTGKVQLELRVLMLKLYQSNKNQHIKPHKHDFLKILTDELNLHNKSLDLKVSRNIAKLQSINSKESIKITFTFDKIWDGKNGRLSIPLNLSTKENHDLKLTWKIAYKVKGIAIEREYTPFLGSRPSKNSNYSKQKLSKVPKPSVDTLKRQPKRLQLIDKLRYFLDENDMNDLYESRQTSEGKLRQNDQNEIPKQLIIQNIPDSSNEVHTDSINILETNHALNIDVSNDKISEPQIQYNEIVAKTQWLIFILELVIGVLLMRLYYDEYRKKHRKIRSRSNIQNPIPFQQTEQNNHSSHPEYQANSIKNHPAEDTSQNISALITIIDNQTLKSRIRNLLGDNKIEEAFQLTRSYLEEYQPESKLYRRILIHSANYKDNIQQEKDKKIHPSEYRRERSRIISSFIETIQEIPNANNPTCL